jgi:hypothetical protein
MHYSVIAMIVSVVVGVVVSLVTGWSSLHGEENSQIHLLLFYRRVNENVLGQKTKAHKFSTEKGVSACMGGQCE